MQLTKTQQYLQSLHQFSLLDYELQTYLLQQSNLPGKRANLELASSFADYIEICYSKEKVMTLNYCIQLLKKFIHNDLGNEEFLPFCALIALGRIGKLDSTQLNHILPLVKLNSNSRNWRVREAAAIAIQELLDGQQPDIVIKVLFDWIDSIDYYVQRAVVVGLAEPRFMKNQSIAQCSLKIHKLILTSIENETSVKRDDFKSLVKSLCYTLSVVITGNESAGFSYLKYLSEVENPIIKKIVKENLKKKRLHRLNERKILELQNTLTKL